MGLKTVGKIIFLAVDIFFLFANALLWQNTFWGAVFLAGFFYGTNAGYTAVLVKIFNFPDNLRAKLLAVFLNFSLLGYLWGASIVFYRLDNIAFITPFVISGLFSLFLFHWSGRIVSVPAETNATKEVEVKTPRNYFYPVFYFTLLFGCFYFLSQTDIASVALTPWQKIPAYYIYIFFLLILVLAGLIRAKFSTGLLLGAIVGAAFLLSATPALTTAYLYGADGWRHIAAEERIMTGATYRPDIFANGELTWVEKINPGRFAYSQFWGVGVASAKIFNVSLLTVARWLLPALWSVVFILLLYELGRMLKLSTTPTLFLCLSGLWPFAFQAGGYFSLPVSLGFLNFLFLLLLLGKRIKNPRQEQVWGLAILGGLSIFGYILFSLLFWLGWFLLVWLKWGMRFSNRVWRWVNAFLAGGVALLAVPLVELTSGFSDRGLKFGSVFGGIKQLLGNLTGYYLASGPRMHLIDTGNIFFYQTPGYAFYANALTMWRWWLILVMIMVIGAIFYGLIKFLGQRDLFYLWWGVLGVGLGGGYVISRYFLSGENILARRLDMVLALFALIFLSVVINKLSTGKLSSRLFVFLIAVIITASYSLGPVSRAMSSDEVEAMKYVWEKIRGAGHPCVVADTYPLLLLEAFSARNIVGGGLPIDENFSQPERVALYEGFLNNYDVYYFQEAGRIAGAEHCIFVGSGGIINDKAEEFMARGGQIKEFGTISVWNYADYGQMITD